MRVPAFCLFLFLTCSARLFTQPLPCSDPPTMQPFCNDACIICDIDGFTGINDAGVQGQAPPQFCTNTAHHMQWIGFIAGSTNLTLGVKVFDCETSQGYGLEVGIFETVDCQNFELVSNCDGDITEGETGIFTNTVPLTIGHYYYFVMDGNHDDVCHYTIEVLDGTTLVQPLPTSGTISGDETVCPGISSTYQLDFPAGATQFRWTLDGVNLPVSLQDSIVTIDWAVQGTYELCVVAANTCDTAPPTCKTIKVQAIPPTLISEKICIGDCVEAAGTTLCTPGIYEFHFPGQEACDSVVFVEIQQYPTSATSLNLLICEGDSIGVGSSFYKKTGHFQDVLTNRFGCDSTVTLDLQVIVCEIQGSLIVKPVDCNGTPTGSLDINIVNATPPLHYVWERIGQPTPKGSGEILDLTNPPKIQNLPTGTYFVTVTDDFGHDVVLFGDVKEPLPLTAALQPFDYHGVNISCFGLSDGKITPIPGGGIAPYQYVWSNGSTENSLDSLPPGTYALTLTDSKGCSTAVETTLTEPEPLDVGAKFTDPGCEGLGTGKIEMNFAEGGILPYEFDLSGHGFDTTTIFENLFSGHYTLTIRDANGCTDTVSGFLTKPFIPEIELGPEKTIDLGESVYINWQQNVPLDTFIWSPTTGLSCQTCPEPTAKPTATTTYVLKVVSPNGCYDVDSVRIVILDKRDVYIPNIFGPEENGLNEFFTVFGGPEVLKINKLEIYSRWGELVFRKVDFPPNIETEGWDGRFRGRKMQPGVFAYIAEVEFIDGLKTVYKGNVSIFK